MFSKSFIFNEITNFVYGIVKNNSYTREYWFKYLDYFNINRDENLLLLITTLYFIIFILCYLFVYSISIAKIKKTDYHKRIF